MITLQTAAELLHAPFRVLPKLTPEDARLNRLLDVAEFHHWRGGERWFRLLKPLPGLPKGMLIELSALHERLFHAPSKKP